MSRRLFLLALALALCDATEVEGVVVAFAYEGIVDYTSVIDADAAPFDAFLGSTLRFEYSFDPATPDSNASANGDYLDALTSARIKLGTNVYSAETGNIILINDPRVDQYIVDIVSTPIVGPRVGGLPPWRASIILTDSTSMALTNDRIPLVPPDPADYESASIELRFRETTGDPFAPMGFIVTRQIQGSHVPEPSRPLLLLVGLAAVLCVGRGNCRGRLPGSRSRP